MSVATFDQLRASAGTVPEGRIKLAKSMIRKDLFLSHSHRDVAHIGAAIQLLESHGASVYVDTLESGSPSPQEMASHLRQAVVRCRRLVALVTEATSSSRWIPWEMGLADGSAGTTQVALLPLRASGGAELWAKQEYFELYARIEYVTLQGEASPCWAVRNPDDGQYWRLAQWLRNTKLVS